MEKGTVLQDTMTAKETTLVVNAIMDVTPTVRGNVTAHPGDMEVTETEIVNAMGDVEKITMSTGEGGRMSARVAIIEVETTSLELEAVATASITERMQKVVTVGVEAGRGMVWEHLRGALPHRLMRPQSRREKGKLVVGMFMLPDMSNIPPCRPNRRVRLHFLSFLDQS